MLDGSQFRKDSGRKTNESLGLKKAI